MKTGPLADAQLQAEVAARQKVDERRRLEVLLAVMDTAAGREFVWDLINRVAGLHAGSWSPDGAVASYKEGRRSVGRELLEELQTKVPASYLTMMTEVLGTFRRSVADAHGAKLEVDSR